LAVGGAYALVGALVWCAEPSGRPTSPVAKYCRLPYAKDTPASKSETSMCWPTPVRSRSRSAAVTRARRTARTQVADRDADLGGISRGGAGDAHQAAAGLRHDVSREAPRAGRLAQPDADAYTSRGAAACTVSKSSPSLRMARAGGSPPGHRPRRPGAAALRPFGDFRSRATEAVAVEAGERRTLPLTNGPVARTGSPAPGTST